MVAVHRRLEDPHHPGQRLDRHLHPGAEARAARRAAPLLDASRTVEGTCAARSDRPVAWRHAAARGAGGRARLAGRAGRDPPRRRDPRRSTASRSATSSRTRSTPTRPVVELDVRRGGLERSVVVDKQAGEPLGLELAAAVFDRVRTCDNHCPFCFIYQLPKGMRRSLYLKDDDYRLSFLYGNFTTLTRFTEADLERVVTERLGPLYVSIHATDPDVRAAAAAQPARRHEPALARARSSTPASRCTARSWCAPASTTATALDDTLLGMLDRFPALATVGVVPLGVSAHSTEAEMRPHTRGRGRGGPRPASTPGRRGSLDALGRRLVFAADEYYLLAGRPFPAAERLRRLRAARERRSGMARTFVADVDRALAGDRAAGRGPRSGSSPGSTARRPTATAPRAPTRRTASPRDAGARRSGSSPASTARRSSRRSCRRWPATPASRCGSSRSRTASSAATSRVTGLLTGADVADALAAQPADRPLPAPRRDALAGPVPRRHAPSTTCPARSRSSPPTAPSLVAAPCAMSLRPTVAVVGRPNVGKSTLVNRHRRRRGARSSRNAPA